MKEIQKKFIKNKKADAIPLAVVIVAIIIFAGMAYVFTGSGSTEYWETETDFGMWQDEFYVVFEDGSEESLKIIEENIDKPFTVSYGGRIITEMGVRITAVISGSGYSGAELKFEGFGVRRDIRTTGGVVKKTYDSIRSDGTIQISLGRSQQILFTEFDLDSTINAHSEIYPNGIYSVRFTPLGTVRYRGYPDGGSFVTASLPPVRVASIMVAHIPTGSITVTLHSEIVTD